MMAQFRREALQQALRDLGYVEGSNVEIEFRSNESPDRLDDFAAQLVSLRVDVIVAAGSQSVRAAQHATSTIPIIMAGVSDPVGTGFVVSLARPSRNITGISAPSPEVSGKPLAVLQETVPGVLRRTAVPNAAG